MKLLTCTACRNAHYCADSDCQKLHWKAPGGHKAACKLSCETRERLLGMGISPQLVEAYEKWLSARNTRNFLGAVAAELLLSGPAPPRHETHVVAGSLRWEGEDRFVLEERDIEVVEIEEAIRACSAVMPDGHPLVLPSPPPGKKNMFIMLDIGNDIWRMIPCGFSPGTLELIRSRPSNLSGCLHLLNLAPSKRPLI